MRTMNASFGQPLMSHPDVILILRKPLKNEYFSAVNLQERQEIPDMIFTDLLFPHKSTCCGEDCRFAAFDERRPNPSLVEPLDKPNLPFALLRQYGQTDASQISHSEPTVAILLVCGSPSFKT